MHCLGRQNQNMHVAAVSHDAVSAVRYVLQDVVDTPAPAAPNASQAIAGLPGVDPNDPAVQAAVRNLQGDKKDEEKKEEGK